MNLWVCHPKDKIRKEAVTVELKESKKEEKTKQKEYQHDKNKEYKLIGDDLC